MVSRLGSARSAPLVDVSKALLSVRKFDICRGTGTNVERLAASTIPDNAQLFNAGTK